MWRKGTVLALTLGLYAAGIGQTNSAGAADADSQVARWGELRKALFQDRLIREDGGGIIQIEIPGRPDNAAAVPVLVKAGIPQSRERFVKNLFMVVDNNPEPLAGVFHLTPESGQADVATNIRVQTDSPVRAIAEMNGGELFMSLRLVKASGGCAAVSSEAVTTSPPGLGRMLIRAQNDALMEKPNRAQVIITHPNHTGLQYDPLKGDPIPAHFIKHLTVRYGGITILRAETGISISEDPSLRFYYYIPRGPGTLNAEVKDSRGLTFTASLEILPK